MPIPNITKLEMSGVELFPKTPEIAIFTQKFRFFMIYHEIFINISRPWKSACSIWYYGDSIIIFQNRNKKILNFTVPEASYDWLSLLSYQPFFINTSDQQWYYSEIKRSRESFCSGQTKALIIFKLTQLERGENSEPSACQKSNIQ